MAATSSSETSTSIQTQSERYIAGGVVSLNRKTTPHLVFTKGEGARLFDADGKTYLDYHAAFAPHLLGHHHPEVTREVAAALECGWSLMGSGTTPWEARLAQRLCEAVPNLERIQILNTGSEASNLAIRLARAHTGREDVVVTLGGYNGWHDEVGRAVMPSLPEIGPRVSPGEYPLLPISAGIPASTQRRIHTVNFNDLASVEAVFQKHSIACLITEPVLQNVGIILPRPGYLQGLRELCDRYGVVFIMDEVKTGFRSALGGYQSVCGVRPDLSLFGKAVANGYPLAVLGGRAGLMDLFADPDPKKRVLVAGTYNGHPIGVAAAIATLDVLTRDDGAVYRQIEANAARLQSGLETVFREAGQSATIVRNASALCFYFMDHAPVDWHDVLEHHDFERDRQFRLGLIEEGSYFFPMPCKQISVSAAHTAEMIDETVEAARRVVSKGCR
ncbi:MAG TPA: aminotransferase class III-fold pyridoxal phosphate-dependent enzyme [Chthoniobacteraceae bacterium]|nr:aminotransferase class III-fold pyridoxal phosphate-dependent enzyme [Chthoniobacteraceae bacterium]